MMNHCAGGVRLRGMTIALVATGAIAGSGSAWAQNITLDGTLGRSATLTGPRYVIRQEDGRAVGSNLFHSLGRFNLDRGERVNFQSDAAIRNILARVTGGARSEIDGLIATQRRAVNLFLINPSGILFGPNARLDVGGSQRGSFVATTTDALVWPDGSRFSATNPNSGNSLLRIVGDPSGFLAIQRNLRPIEVRGNAARRSILAVYPGQSLILLGGDILIDKGVLGVYSPEGGQIEVGGVVGASTVGLTVADNELRLGFPDSVGRADVAITNGSTLDVRAASGGNLVVYARNLDISQSYLLAGIAEDLGSSNSRAGDLTVDATGSLTVRQNSRLGSEVNPGATGNSGNLQIRAGTLSVSEGSLLSSGTYGNGNAGNVIINARDRIVVDGTPPTGQYATSIFSTVGDGARGNGGNVEITTRLLTLINGASLDSSTYGQGSSGNVIINARDRITFDGTSPDNQFYGGAYSTVGRGARGTGGNVEITTGDLTLTHGAELNASTFGQGNSGNVIINARDRITFDGTTPDGEDISGAFSTVRDGARGNGGNVQVNTNSITLTNGAALSASTFGQGNSGNVIINARDRITFDGTSPDNQFYSGAYSTVGRGVRGTGGNVEITTGDLTLTNGAELDASTYGQGNSGNVIVNAHDRITFDGTSPDGNFVSGAFSNVGNGARGKGGDIKVSASSIILTNGGLMLASTLGQGNAGNVLINAQDYMVLDGTTPDGRFSSSVFSRVEIGGRGNAGNIELITGSLTLTNSAVLSTSTFGQGNAGNVVIHARDRIVFDGSTPDGQATSGVFSTVRPGARGQGGNIQITTGSLAVTNGAEVGARTLGQGAAGNVIIEARDSVLLSGTTPGEQSSSGLFVSSDSGSIAGNITVTTPRLRMDHQGVINAQSSAVDGGNITLNVADVILLRRGSQISATAGTARAGGDGGNITINSPNGFIVGVLSENSDITANAFTGNGGNVNITAQGIYGLQFQPRLTPNSDITASSEFGFNGTVTLNIPDTDPSRGFLSLSIDLSDPTTRLDTRCQPGSRGYASSYIETGRSGIPASPDDLFTADPTLPNWVMPPSRPHSPTNSTSQLHLTPPLHHPPTPLTEANALLRAPNGDLYLVASRSLSPQDFWRPPINCGGNQPRH